MGSDQQHGLWSGRAACAVISTLSGAILSRVPAVVISSLLPAGVAAAELWGPRRQQWLHPDERPLVAGSAASAIAAFSSARACARRALAELGHPPAAILRGAHHEPLWPAGLVGSITHCRGYLAAVLAPAGAVPVLGIDAEPHAPLVPGLLAMIASAAEREHLAARPAGVHWDRLLFCAKESVYKAWFPLTGRWLDFDQAEIRFDSGAGSFTARLTAPGSPVPAFGGDWRVAGGVLLAAVTRLA